MIAIISDVHGNYPALKAVLNKIDQLGCEQIISLGDVSGYYCMVNECIEEFRRRKIINILGNHDFYTLGRGDCPRSFTVKKCTEYQRRIITSENINYLMESVDYLDTKLFSARHGGWRDPLDEYIEEFNFSIAKDFKTSLFCSGHTHIQCMKEKGHIVYFNPGSVGQPRDEDCRAGFAVINDTGVQLYRVDYDINQIAAAMESAGFEQRTYECLYKGTKIGG